MKKHQACYWLNDIADEFREHLVAVLGRPPLTVMRDETGKMRPATQKESSFDEAWRHDEAKKINARLEALEIAAESLAK